MTVTELIETIKQFEETTTHRPHGITMHPSDAMELQDDLMAGNESMAVYAAPLEESKVPAARDGEQHVMTFRGVPIFLRRKDITPGEPRLWVER